MRILVTGAGGLIGAHLLPLLKVEHDVFTISKKLEGEPQNINIDFGNEWSPDVLPGNIDVIIHLAQSENFRDFPAKAKEVFYTNTVSTLKLIDFANSHKVSQFIFASSAGLYGNSDLALNEEQDILYKKELGFYLATKHCSENILDNYTDMLNVVQLRFFFVYGKGQRKDMLMARLVDNVKNERPIALAGTEGIKINPVHATDAAKAIMASLNLSKSEKINVGGSEVLTLRQIVEIIGKAVGKEPLFIEHKEQLPKHLFGDITKMNALLINPQIEFEKGIKTLL